MKWYNANKGFGFISPDQGGKDIFVHASALERAGIVGLAEGQRVAIDVAQGRKGPEVAASQVNHRRWKCRHTGHIVPVRIAET